jgi:DNA-directed RNA polymerase specialized sigma subunit
MEITIKIKQSMINKVRKEVKEFTGKEPTDKQIEKFFREDIQFMYGEQFEDGLLDAVELHFG